MRSKQLLIGLAAVGLLVTACGSSKKASTATTPPATAAATTAAGSTAATTAGSGGTTPATLSTAVGTAAPGSAPSGATVDCKPVKAGVLSVITSLPGPNFWGTSGGELDPTNIKSGLEYDMANDIAAKCGLKKMEFRNKDFSAIVAGQIPSGSYDLILSQVTITDDRAKVVDFSSPYFTADQGVLVKKGVTISSWADLAKMSVGVQADTTAETDLMDPKDGIKNLKSFPDLTSAYEALSAGQVDAVVIDTPINLGQAAQSNGEETVVAQFKTGESYGAIFPKGSDRKAIFDPIIKGLVDDGTIKALTVKYFKGDPASVPFIEPPS